MLIGLRFSNFRSFKDRQELSLVAGPFSDKPEIPKYVDQIKRGVLPVAAIYGANASGKTNVLRAFEFISEAVMSSHSKWKPDGPVPNLPFLGQPDPAATPSEFEIEFLAEGVRFLYAFRVNSICVLEEWLHAYPHGKKQVWFHRTHGKPMVFGAKLPGANKTIENLMRKNSLFLSAAAQNNHEALLAPYRWITGVLHVSGLRTHDLTLRLCKSAEYFADISRLMSAADLGIASLEMEVEQWATALAPPNEDLQPRLMHRLGGREVAFEPDLESQGTLTYLSLVGAVVDSLRKGAPLLVDELDASLHTVLSMNLIRLFNDPETNPKGAQLIFNTHDTSLLSSGDLRRDEIWFTEKGVDGSSRLFPLSDFKLRRSENMESGYLLGRYGAVPLVDSAALLARFADSHAVAK